MDKRVYNLRPLPGGRRGAPGADAGCLSMRTIGDEELNRRAPVEEYVTAESSSCSSSPTAFHTSPSSSLYIPSSSLSSVSSNHSTVDVVQSPYMDNLSASAAVSSRTRKKWSVEMNIFIVRTYFILTSLETINTNAYLTPLHAEFIKRFPNMQVSKQRVGDQRRAIMYRNLLTTHKIQEIREEVRLLLEKELPSGIPYQAIQNSTQSQRRIWTNDINETIIRSYYTITNLEKNITAYRTQLHKEVIAKHPSISDVSVQRIADQRRVIVNNKLIKPQRLLEIRKEVELLITDNNMSTNQNETKTLNTTEPINEIEPILHSMDIQCTEIQNTTLNNDLDEQQPTNYDKTNQSKVYQLTDEEKSAIEAMFSKFHSDFSNTPPTQRPFIPKQKCSKKFCAIVDFINLTLLPKHLKTDNNFDTLHTLLYCSALTAAVHNGLEIKPDQVPIQGKRNIPRWQMRLEERIKDLRVKIGRITEYVNGNRNHSLQIHVHKIKLNYKIHTQHETENVQLVEFLDTLKQKLSALANRLRRYTQARQRKVQNKQFIANEKQFYKKLGKSHNNNNDRNTNNKPNRPESPTASELYNFWSSIWSIPVEHKQNSWIDEQNHFCEHLPLMEFETVDENLLKYVINRTHNWKATGTDRIHNYWYKKLTSIHKPLLIHINSFIKSPNTLPQFLTQGITYMLAKDKADICNPAKYRPITCLQTLYKIITACITELIYKHIDSNSILAEQQKGCRRYSQGCKEQLIIDFVTSKQALTKRKNIYTMYIDYKKAFDSVPHSWLLYILKLYKISPIIIEFLKCNMQKWTTKLKVNNNGHTVETEPISIRRGIFQGDSLSPLWFCLSINPLSDMLNKSNKGYNIKQTNTQYTLSHLIYMDDIKLYASNLRDIKKLADITEMFSVDIKMELGIDKCKMQSIRRGKKENNTYELKTGEKIEEIDNDNGYRYLGYQQTRQIHQRETKIEINQKFKQRLTMILNTNLNSRNTIKAINTFVVPILTYSFGIIRWSQSELQKLQRTINTQMTKFRKHHPRSCIQRLTTPKHEGGRGLIDIKNLHNKQITSLRKFFHDRAQISVFHKAVVKSDCNYTPLNLQNEQKQQNENITTLEQKLNVWQAKSLHGRHRNDLLNPNVDKNASNAWLKKGELFPETEGFMLAIQDQIIETRNYKKHIIHDTQIDLCRHCHSASETIQHITGACKSIAQTDYKHRHDQVACIIHQYLAKNLNLISETVPYYKYKPQSVIDTAEYKLYWDRTIITDRTVHHNRPDLTLHIKKLKTVYLIDIAIPNTHNLSSTFTEKITKYTDLSIELKSQWRVNTVKTVPIILSSTGVIPITLHSCLKQLNLHPLLYIQLQKAVILNTCRIVRKFLSYQ